MVYWFMLMMVYANITRMLARLEWELNPGLLCKQVSYQRAMLVVDTALEKSPIHGE